LARLRFQAGVKPSKREGGGTGQRDLNNAEVRLRPLGHATTTGGWLN